MINLRRKIADQVSKQMDAMTIGYATPIWMELRRELRVEQGNPVTDAWLIMINRMLRFNNYLTIH